MPLQKLQFRPGVNREGTTLANEGGWYDCDKVRFRSGYPEKIGGWAVESYVTFMGLCRSLWNWITLKNFNLMGVGTNSKFYVESGGEYYDITPIRLSTTNTVTFAATNGSPAITVTDSSASGIQVGDFVTFSGVDVNGLGVGGNITKAILEQEYQIQAAISNTQYTIYARGSGTSVTGVSFTVNPTTSVITLPVATVIANGDKVVLVTGVTAPTGLNYATVYYLVDVSNNTCKLSLSNGGAPVAITSEGIGLQALYFVVSANASDSGNGGGSDAAYQINSGYPIYTIGTGWGTGAWVPYGVVTLTDPFATTNGSSTITVTQNGHGLTTGQYVYFASISDTSISGISNTILQKSFEVTVIGANTYTISTVIGQAPGPVITYTANATDAAEGGTVVVYFPAASVVGSSRLWGSGTSTGFGLQLRLWSQSNFGEDLLFSPRGGALYLWQPGIGVTPAYGTRGIAVSTLPGALDVPTQINEIMVSDSSRIVIAFGCNPYNDTILDPMLIRWSAQESYTNWDPEDTTTQAGFQRLSHGSEIVAALQTRQEINVWTDAAIYSMQYIGPPFVWQITLLADNISIASPNAMATASGVVYWMGVDKFYVYSGRVETLPCSVRTYIYEDINRDQFAQIYAGTNEGFSEIWWFYCSSKSDIIDRYVIFNYLDRVWYYGTLDRTAWLDTPLRQFPAAATSKGLLVYHESAIDDGSTNPPSPISAYIQSSDFDIGDGHNYGFVWRMIPDITFNGSNTAGLTTERPQVNFTVRPRQNPGSAYGVSDSPEVKSGLPQTYKTTTTYNVQEFTEIVYTRIRGRQMAFKVESNTLGTQWQLGVPRIDARPDGRR